MLNGTRKSLETRMNTRFSLSFIF